MVITSLKHIEKCPVTIYYNGHGVVPERTQSYRVVRVLNTIVGSSIGLRYGVIVHNYQKMIVVSRMQSNNSWSQWELIDYIRPL